MTENTQETKQEIETPQNSNLSEIITETETPIEEVSEQTTTEEINEPQAENDESVAETNISETVVETAENTEAETQISTPVDDFPEATETKIPKAKKKTESKVTQVTNAADTDFDWDIDKEGFSNYDNDSKNQLMEMYRGTFNQLTERQVVKGKVVSISQKDVVVNVGFKSDGIVNRTEFRDFPDLKVGDTVEVYVEKTEDALGQLILSRRKAIAESAWDRIIEIKEENRIVTGLIKSRTKGGLVVDIMGMDTFLPGSQIDVKSIKDYDVYVGQTMEFKIVKVNEAFKNIVISHKALIEDDIEAQKGEILSRLEKGQILEGIVKNMTNFGVFIDLGGLDGLLHITDISWGRINHPAEVLHLEQKINVVVLDFDDEKKRISLGLKQLSNNPWESLEANLTVGSKIKGKVVTVADYGAFVEITPGVEGLIHVSEMSWSQHLKNPQDFMKVGDEIEAIILTLDKDEQKMSLGIKQLTPDPWVNIEIKYGIGSKHKGIVRNLTNYGLFIELEEGVDGLVHVSDLSWSKKIKHPAEFTKKGEEMDVIVLEIDRENRRLSLGHKQLDENPWDTFEDVFTVGSEHTGTVLEVNEKGSTVALPYGVEGFAPTKHIKKEGQKAGNAKVDDELPFRVIEFNKDQKRIILSHTDIWKDAERARKEEEKSEIIKNDKNTSKAIKNFNQKTERQTLGEIEALSDLKAKMDSNAKNAEKKAKKVEITNTVAEKTEENAEKTAKKSVAKSTVKKADEKSSNIELLKTLLGEATEENQNDLKAIVGIGPKFEKTLHSMGIYTYQQISKLNDESIAILEELTKFPGRVERENWVGQAKELMKS